MNDLLFTQGEDNLAGVIGFLDIVPVNEVLTIPALASASSLSITGDIVLAASKKWLRLYFTDETGKVEMKTVGERDGKGIETMISVRYPKLRKELIDWIRNVQNTPCLVSYKMGNTGKRFVMGLTQFDISSTVVTADIPVYFESAEVNSGEKRADQNGALLSWKYTSQHGPIEYAGTMDYTP
jgi:hypothetical protein